MEHSEYERLAAVEERLWWFKGLHANLLAAWRRAGTVPAAPNVLDAGCGTGGFLMRLGTALSHEGRTFGLDLDEGAARVARGKGRCPVAVASVAQLPFADASFDAIFSADVLCHRGVDEDDTLAGFHRCLRPGGVLVLNLPAYRWLYSAHDVAVDNARRYGRDEVLRFLDEAGFRRVRARHWNGFLFPLMVLRRKLGKPAGGESDVALLPPAIERLFSAIVALESRLFAAGISLPFGGSILATAVRP